MFIFLVFTLMWVANLCTAQAKIQIAVNSAAKEISAYSYLYGLTGLNDKQKKLYDEGAQATGIINEAVDGISGVYNSITDAATDAQNAASGDISFGDFSERMEAAAKGGKASAAKVNGAYEQIKKDPKAFLINLAKATTNEFIDEEKSAYIAAPLAKLFCEKNLQTTNMSANQYLAKLGVIGGFDGIDFTKSTLFKGGSEEIVITARYRMKVIQFFNIDVTYNFEQSGYTTPWFGQQSKSETGNKGD